MAFDVKEMTGLSPRVGGGLMCFGFFVYIAILFHKYTYEAVKRNLEKEKKQDGRPF